MIPIYLPDGSTNAPCMFIWAMFGVLGTRELGLPTAVLELNSDWLNCF